ncbi:MAG TPA: lysylphosphatidylglycerol synthase domain-containing protein, partial [Thermoanaerobaculia bacterium]|nr:lysylphosphatidylglycerol synthase domain-containing protein [Thermoanaerobaculia bacterium]
MVAKLRFGPDLDRIPPGRTLSPRAYVIKKTLLHRLAPLLGVILFSVALWLLHRELRNFHYRDVLAYLHGLPSSRILMALGLTLASYLVLTGYDYLAVRHLGKRIPYWKTALASFIGYSFSNSLGNPIFTSTPIRVRYYSAWGLSALEVAKVIGFCFLTFWLGFCTLGGATFVLAPIEIPSNWHAPFASLTVFGLLLLLVPIFYMGASFVRRRPVRFKTWELNFPSPSTSIAQITISSLDWLLAASVLYSLLPSGTHLSLPTFLSGFLLAQVAGLISLVPGGLGIFESVIVLVFAPQIPAPVLVGTLLAYRGVYYLLPLSSAAMVLVVLEVLERRERFSRLVRGFGEILPSIVPQVIALTTFLGGTILLFSGATPARHSRLAWLNAFLPLPIIEASHFLASLAGVVLLFLARGLQRRLDGAYHLATVLLAG